jgi:hypothetical protein
MQIRLSVSGYIIEPGRDDRRTHTVAAVVTAVPIPAFLRWVEGEKKHFPSPNDVPELMKNLKYWTDAMRDNIEYTWKGGSDTRSFLDMWGIKYDILTTHWVPSEQYNVIIENAGGTIA